ncbi:MAG: hypothetical protein R2856_33035 [Caldilineaceae bacterium]
MNSMVLVQRQRALISGADDGNVFAWDLESGERLLVLARAGCCG